jgi:hypothetical protein
MMRELGIVHVRPSIFVPSSIHNSPSQGLLAVLRATQLQPLELQSDNDDGGGARVAV